MKLMPIKMLNSKIAPRTVVLESEMTNKQAEECPPARTYKRTCATMASTSNKVSVGNSLSSMLPLGKV